LSQAQKTLFDLREREVEVRHTLSPIAGRGRSPRLRPDIRHESLRPSYVAPLALAACGGEKPVEKEAAESTAAAGDYERGPNHGRMLRDGDFALEVTVYETNTPPQFRLYAYRNDKPISPNEVKATMQLKRLDGEVNDFTFTAENDYLVGNGEVVEPHSFDVKATQW
jgi:hypothetical protein